MRIMITGGSGFIGSHLCDKFLNDKHEIILVTKPDSKLDNISHLLENVTVKKIDVINFDKMGKMLDDSEPDVIIHLAGQTSHSKSFENPLYDVDVNTKSTLFILEKIRNSNLKCRFILGSTFIVVGKPLKLPINEETPCNPTTIYGANRLASEHYCKIYNSVYGVDAISFRITNSFGPREQIVANKNAINYLIYRSFKGEEITIFNKGKFFRDIIYVSDVISAINKIMKRGKSGNLYWISSGKKTWFYQLGEWLKELTNATVKYTEPPQYTKKVDVGNFLVNNSKLKLLGWEAKVPVRDGIQRTLEYFKSIK